MTIEPCRLCDDYFPAVTLHVLVDTDITFHHSCIAAAVDNGYWTVRQADNTITYLRPLTQNERVIAGYEVEVR